MSIYETTKCPNCYELNSVPVKMQDLSLAVSGIKVESFNKEQTGVLISVPKIDVLFKCCTKCAFISLFNVSILNKIKEVKNE